MQYHLENSLNFINFYNLFNASEEDIMACDQFDRLGKGRSYIANLSLLNNSKKVYLDSREYIKNIIYVKTFEILGIDKYSLEGVFKKVHLDKLKSYFRTEFFEINGVRFSVLEELKGTLKFTSTDKTYLSTIIRNFLSEQFGLELASKSINIKGVDDNYKYWIDQSSVDELLRFYSQVKQKT